MLHWSTVCGRGNKEMIVRNSLHVWQTSGLAVLSLCRYQRPLWHHQGVTSRTVCFRTTLVKSESSERSKLRTSPAFFFFCASSLTGYRHIFAVRHWVLQSMRISAKSAWQICSCTAEIAFKAKQWGRQNIFIFSKWIETTQKYEATLRDFFPLADFQQIKWVWTGIKNDLKLRRQNVRGASSE